MNSSPGDGAMGTWAGPALADLDQVALRQYHRMAAIPWGHRLTSPWRTSRRWRSIALLANCLQSLRVGVAADWSWSGRSDPSPLTELSFRPVQPELVMSENLSRRALLARGALL